MLIRLYKILDRNRFTLVHLPFYLLWIVLIILTSIPSDSMPIELGIYDKVEHFLAYFALSGMLFFALHFQEKFTFLKHKNVISTIAICSLYGLFDELHQIPIPGRYFDLLDLAANYIGISIGVFLAIFVLKKMRKSI